MDEINEKIEPTWLSYEEAGRLVGLGRTTLWRLARDGDINAARVGRAVRIERESLENYLRLQAQDMGNPVSNRDGNMEVSNGM